VSILRAFSSSGVAELAALSLKGVQRPTARRGPSSYAQSARLPQAHRPSHLESPQIAGITAARRSGAPDFCGLGPVAQDGHRKAQMEPK